MRPYALLTILRSALVFVVAVGVGAGIAKSHGLSLGILAGYVLSLLEDIVIALWDIELTLSRGNGITVKLDVAHPGQGDLDA